MAVRLARARQRRRAGPLYHQLKQYLLDRIESEELKPGQRIPSERELARRFRISRMTVRQAIADLVHEDVLFRQQGRGTYLADPKLEQGLLELSSFSEDMRRRGLTPGATVLDVRVVRPTRKVERALLLGPGRRVVRIRRLRLAGGEPMALETSHLSENLLRGVSPDRLEGSLYRLLEEELGIELSLARQTLEPTVAGEEEAALLRVPPRTPLLLMERTTYGKNGEPIEFVQSLYRGDRYKFYVELRRPSRLRAT